MFLTSPFIDQAMSEVNRNGGAQPALPPTFGTSTRPPAAVAGSPPATAQVPPAEHRRYGTTDFSSVIASPAKDYP